MVDYAYDFSVVPGPDVATLVDLGAQGVLVYSFGARQSDAYLDECRALGLKVVWIWERNTDSILSANGADECRAHEQSAKPGELTYVACDLNNGALNGRDVIRFCREWAATTREAEFGLYGPQDAIAQGQAFGIPKLTKWWGVVNWITGGGPDNAPGNIAYWQGVGAHLVQLIGSPIPNTDQNLILKADWASLGTAAPPKTNPLLVLLEDDVHFETDPANRADIWRFDGNTRKHLTPDEWAIEKAKHAYTFVAAGLPAQELKPFAGTPRTFANTSDITPVA